MKTRSFHLVTSVLVSFFFVCCAPSSKQNLDAAVVQQKISSDPCSASSACTKAFNAELIKFEKSNSDEFCNELVKRSDGDLAICEVDIRNTKFSSLLVNCKSNLTKRMDQIVVNRNQGLQVHANVFSNEDIGLGFKLPTEVQFRDTANGYRAVTGDIKPKQVILTFDDGPEQINTLSVLRTLTEVGAKAHFFEVGQRIQASPEVTKQISEQGHAIGNHSWTHPNMQLMSFEDSVAEIKKTQSLLLSVLGWVDPFFRFPYGNRTPELTQVLTKNQMGEFYWAVDSNDWRMVNTDGSVRTNLQVVTDTVNELDHKGRGVILMHDIHRRTAELLPELLRLLNQKGYSTVVLQPKDSTLKTNPTLLSDGRLP
ncbi:MAG: polysaccharide deacetylase family protein [Pseudobdellovibrio sp.]